MKRITILLIVCTVLVCTLVSCVVVNKEINIDGKSANLIVDELDAENYNITFDGNSYVFSGNYDEFFFYRVHTEPVDYFWGLWGLSTINAGQIEELGTVFTLSYPIWDSIFGGANLTTSSCYFSEKVVMPNKEELIVDDIVVVSPSGVISNYMFCEFYCEEDLKSHYSSTIIDKSLWNEENKDVSWGEILDFENPITFDRNINIPEGNHITFTFKDYKTFVGGIFHLVSIDDEWYLGTNIVSADNIAYRINNEYLNIFDGYYD